MPETTPARPSSSGGCEAIVATFVHGPERCRRAVVTYVKCEDMFCSALHPACEQHSTGDERQQASQRGSRPTPDPTTRKDS